MAVNSYARKSRIETGKEARGGGGAGGFVFQNLGVMRARVEYNNDPWKIGRLKVRIPSIHGIEGTKEVVKQEDLPWAMPCVPFGCGEDFGSMTVPVPGTFVWVFFEDDDTNKPVYFGGVPSKGGTLSKMMNNLTSEYSPLQRWFTQPLTPETPTDVFNGKPTGVPERHVIYKSQKGHTIMMDDTDAEESIWFIDRLGQEIVFKCPVSVADNKGGYRRKLCRADKGDQLTKAAQVPSIMMRSGATTDLHHHYIIEMFQDHYHSESINEDESAPHGTINDTKWDRYYQRTYKSEHEMLEDSIRMQYKDIVKEFMDDEQYYVQYKQDMIELKMCDDFFHVVAFDKVEIEGTKKHLLMTYDGEGFEIDKDGVHAFFKGTTTDWTEEDIQMKTDKIIHGQATDIHWEADGAEFKTSDGNAYVKGSEVHLN